MIHLDQLRVASPCHEAWDRMDGDDRHRSCDRCQKNVYNISEMTSDEAASLIAQHEGKLCVRFYRREDGTVMTKDCPVGAARVRKRRTISFAWAVSMAIAALDLSSQHNAAAAKQAVAVGSSTTIFVKRQRPAVRHTKHPAPRTVLMGMVKVPVMPPISKPAPKPAQSPQNKPEPTPHLIPTMGKIAMPQPNITPPSSPTSYTTEMGDVAMPHK